MARKLLASDEKKVASAGDPAVPESEDKLLAQPGAAMRVVVGKPPAPPPSEDEADEQDDEL
jgi:hypothetical protein